MLQLREKRIIRKILFGRVTVVVLLILVIIIARGTWNMYQKSQFAQGSRNKAEKQLLILQKRKESLEVELARLNTQRGIESELRQKFDVGRKGEHLIVLVDAPEKNQSATIKKRNIFIRVWHLLTFWNNTK